MAISVLEMRISSNISRVVVVEQLDGAGDMAAAFWLDDSQSHSYEIERCGSLVMPFLGRRRDVEKVGRSGEGSGWLMKRKL